MGGLFKKKSSKSTETTKSENTNLFAQNKTFMNEFNQAIGENSNMNIPGYQLADYGQGWYSAIQNLTQGADFSDFADSADYMGGVGKSQLQSGLAMQNTAMQGVNRFANMTQADFDKGIANEYNSDLVNQQVNAASEDINNLYMKQVQGLNQSAVATGNMGSSREGIAQAMLGSEAQKNLSRTALQYRTAEESAATNRYNMLLGYQSQGVNQLASMANQQIGYGSQFINQGLGYRSTYNAGYLQNQQNAINAGALLQNQQQSQLDIQRQNMLMAQSPIQTRLAYLSGSIGGLANSATYGNQTTTRVMPAQGNGLMGGIMGAAGAVAGGFFGGPMGASLGASLGGSLGQAM